MTYLKFFAKKSMYYKTEPYQSSSKKSPVSRNHYRSVLNSNFTNKFLKNFKSI